MSLERRLSDALHLTDDYQPSQDLFVRLTRSIEEDRAHRRRLLGAGAAIIVGLGGLAMILYSLSSRDSEGTLLVPKWSTQMVALIVLTSLLLAFGPAIRRLGQPLLADVFHLSPPTGDRFSRLLDIAYYLFFGGGILTSLDLVDAGSLVPMSEGLTSSTWQVANFLTLLGLAHVGNLLVLPIVGLLFASLTRRERRRSAGASVPPVSERAKRVDRLAAGIAFAALFAALGGGLAVILFLGIYAQ